MPSLRVPGDWANEPVTPALLRWRVLRDGSPDGGWRTAADFRSRMIDATQYHSIYAPATTQNHPGRPGLFCFYLSQAGSRPTAPTGSRSRRPTPVRTAPTPASTSPSPVALSSAEPSRARSFRQDSQPFRLTPTRSAAHATSPHPPDRSRGPGSPGRGCRVPVAGQAVRPAASGPRLLRRPAHGLRRRRERERDRGAGQLHLPPGRRHRGARRNGDLRGRERPHPLRRRRDAGPRHPRRHDDLPVLPHRRRRRRGAARDGAADGARLRAGAVRTRARHGDPARARRQPAAARPPHAVRRPHAARRWRGSSSRTRTASSSSRRGCAAGCSSSPTRSTRRRCGFRGSSTGSPSRRRS